jgi:hypothetical protein
MEWHMKEIVRRGWECTKSPTNRDLQGGLLLTVMAYPLPMVIGSW